MMKIIVNKQVEETINKINKEYPNLEWGSYIMGTVSMEDKTINIEQLIIVDQEVTGVTVDLTSNFEQTLLINENSDRIIGWHHSHNRMGVTPSGQDERSHQEWYTSNNGLVITMITNNAMDLYLKATVECYGMAIDLPLQDSAIVFDDSNIEVKIEQPEYKITQKGSQFRLNNTFANNKNAAYRGKLTNNLVDNTPINSYDWLYNDNSEDELLTNDYYYDLI